MGGNNKLALMQPHTLTKQQMSLKLSSAGKADIVQIVMQANISRPNNFTSLSTDEWIWIVDKIQSHPKYKRISLEKLNIIIENGIIGKYNDRQPAINAFTIFKWIETWWNETPDDQKGIE